jgi:hypothetical protein
LAIPIGPDETLPELPTAGVEPDSSTTLVKGAQFVDREKILPGADPSQYAYLNGGVHRNLYRISLQ